MTYAIANHHGYHFTREETRWPVFDQNQEYCGQIQLIRAWTVPTEAYKPLGLPNHLDLFLTSEGHWAPTLEIAEHLLINTEAPQEFIVKGNTLSLFVSSGWMRENGTPNTDRDYRVYQRAPGVWDAEWIKPLVLLASKATRGLTDE